MNAAWSAARSQPVAIKRHATARPSQAAAAPRFVFVTVWRFLRPSTESTARTVRRLLAEASFNIITPLSGQNCRPGPQVESSNCKESPRNCPLRRDSLTGRATRTRFAAQANPSPTPHAVAPSHVGGGVLAPGLGRSPRPGATNPVRQP